MRHPALLALLLLLFATASWLLHEPTAPPPAEPVPGQTAGRQVDYYLRGLTATTMGADGKPARTLHAAQARHFEDDNTTELEQPRLIVHQGEEPPWEVVSESGLVSAEGDVVLLQGEVQIDRTEGSDNRPLHLKTRNLRVQPREDYAETDEQVRVRSNRDRLDASGMQAWLRQPSRIKFLDDVKGYYAPVQ